MGQNSSSRILITDFSIGSIDREFPSGVANSEKIRCQYLPIEGPHSELHDRLPAITLAQGSPRFRMIQFIHVLKLFRVEVAELKSWTDVGSPVIHFQEEAVRALLDWHQALRLGPAASQYHEQRQLLKQQGLAGLLNTPGQVRAGQNTMDTDRNIAAVGGNAEGI